METDKNGVLGKHILIGNGFSIELWPSFDYTSLFEEAGFGPDEKLLFDKRYDFEEAISKLNTTLEILEKLKVDNLEATNLITNLINGKKETISKKLIDAIKKVHPPNLDDLLQESKQKQYLKILSKFDTLFTLNYDLLLYWLINRGREEKWSEKAWVDGFGRNSNTESSLYYQSHGAYGNPNFFHLHGALYYIFHSDVIYELEKLYADKNKDILEKLEDYIKNGLPPFYVCEGSSEHKLKKFSHSIYLDRALARFTQIEGILVLYGTSLDDKDNHVWERIEENKKLKKLYVSYHNGNQVEIESKARHKFNSKDIKFISSGFDTLDKKIKEIK